MSVQGGLLIGAVRGDGNSAAAGIKDHADVVLAAGDDISLPERTKQVFEAWNDSARKATSLYSRFSVIDERGQPASGDDLEDHPPDERRPFIHQQATLLGFVRRRRPLARGCTHAISRRLFSEFGPVTVCDETRRISVLGRSGFG